MRNYFGSLFNGHISDFSKRQTGHLVKCQEATLKVNVLSVNQQNNSVDCGMYALAYIWSILNNASASELNFDKSKMRSHLCKCYSSRKLSNFPTLPEVGKKNKTKTVEFELYCSCRMPWKKGDCVNNDTKMAQCDSCLEWFHRQ